jgi:hypothetical protein
VKALVEVEKAFSAQGVVFNLFALCIEPGIGWSVVVATTWFDDPATRESRALEVKAAIQACAPPDLFGLLRGVEFFGPGAVIPLAFYNFGWVGGAGMRISNSVVIGGGRVAAPVRHPGLFIADNVMVDGRMLPKSYVIALQPI